MCPKREYESYALYDTFTSYISDMLKLGCTTTVGFGHSGHTIEPNRLLVRAGFPHSERGGVDMRGKTIKVGEQI